MATILQFSGGADSLATLFVKREEWDKITVLWLDTGAAYPETHKLMERVSNLVPHFVSAKSDKPKWESLNGIAVDLVPERYTLMGHMIHGTMPPPFYTSWSRCCAANIWLTLDKASRDLGANVVIRGQRKEEARKAPITTGHVHNGIRYEFPVEDWSKAEVLAYCEKTCPDLLPAYYRTGGEKSSHDCWDCIAFLDDNVERIANMTGEMRERMNGRLAEYRNALRKDLEVIRA